MKLTDTQLVLLSTASQREDGTVEIGSKLKGGAAGKLVGKLLRQHLIEEIPAEGGLPVWRRDEEKGARALRITADGRTAIGADSSHVEPAGVRLPVRGDSEPSRATSRGGRPQAGRRSATKAGKVRRGRVEAGGGDRHAAKPEGDNHSRHHDGDRLAAALGARLLCRGGPQEARPNTGIREGR
jgi:hypothetical protein